MDLTPVHKSFNSRLVLIRELTGFKQELDDWSWVGALISSKECVTDKDWAFGMRPEVSGSHL